MNTKDNIQEKITNGLTRAQVEERTAQGLVNGELDVKTKSYGRIVRDNLFTLFNLINVILLFCILISGSIKNALFFLVVIWNFAIGTFQEIRAKKTIEKLSLLSAPKAHVLRDGTVLEIPVKDVVLGEILELKNGQQICADCIVRQGSCQVNESLVTGESTSIYKKEGDHLLSGSFLVSGRVLAETEHIGADNYVNQITLGAKYFKKPESVIVKSVRSIVRILVICMIPLSGLFVWNYFFRLQLSFSSAMVKSVAMISSMIPGGLILLVSVVLAVSVVRLSMHHTLVQDLYCVENLARVDTLLLDKTGTITEGVLKLEEICMLPEVQVLLSPEEVYNRLSFFMQHNPDENATAAAIRDYIAAHPEKFPVSGTVSAEDDSRFAVSVEDDSLPALLPAGQIFTVPFSSERKWSMVSAPGIGCLVLGASEFVLKDRTEELQAIAAPYTGLSKRVVLFAIAPEDQNPSVNSPAAQAKEGLPKTAFLPEGLIPAAFLIISDYIRETAPATFRFFEEEGVDIKVISGDSPATVSAVAQEAGLKGAEKWVDASGLTDETLIKEAAGNYTVFGRVTPQQKLEIVKALKEQGHTVAMTGDGANDVLALREADCSIAMQSGSEAARNVANLVLLDSDFSSLPLVVAEGRKSINNLQRSAALYLTKTVYAIVFAVFFLFAVSLTYPFENIQVTLIGAISIGIPSFFLALEPNNSRIRKNFLYNVLRLAIPTGLLEAAALIVMLLLFRNMNLPEELSEAQLSSASVYLMLILGLLAVFNISGRLNLWKAGLLLFLAILSAGAVLVLPGLFSLTVLPFAVWKAILLISAGFLAVHTILFRVLWK